MFMKHGSQSSQSGNQSHGHCQVNEYLKCVISLKYITSQPKKNKLYNMDETQKPLHYLKELCHTILHIVWFHLFSVTTIGKSLETEFKLVVSRWWRKGRKKKWYRASFWGCKYNLMLDSGNNFITVNKAQNIELYNWKWWSSRYVFIPRLKTRVDRMTLLAISACKAVDFNLTAKMSQSYYGLENEG
jgi:hypothetical protein